MLATSSIDKFVQQTLSAVTQTPRDERTGLPTEFYTHPDVLALDKHKIFAQEWVCIGRSDEVPNAGDYITTQILDEPILMVRDDKRQLHVLANVCRHRCMQVASGHGKGAKGFNCPYHAWRYDLTGQLIAAPLMKKTNFDTNNYRLPAIKFEVWQGFVFATLNDAAEPLAPRLTGLDTLLANYHSEAMLHEFVEQDVWHCNWKILIENFIEAYHLSFVHPQTLRPVTPSTGAEKLSSSAAYTAYGANYDTAYTSATQFSHPDLTDIEAKRSTLFCVYPSLLVSQSPHLLVYLAVQPISEDRLRLRWGMCIRDSAMRGKTFDDLLALWRQINQEDRAKLEVQQQALQSRYATPGPLGPEDLEGTIRDFHDYLATMLI